MFGDISMTDERGAGVGSDFSLKEVPENRRRGFAGGTVSANASFTLFWIIQEMGAFERDGPLRPSQIVGPNIGRGL